MAVLALAGVAWVGVVLSVYAPALIPRKVAAGPPFDPTKIRKPPVDESRSWTHSKLFVVRPDQGPDRRPVVVLGHPTGATEPRLPGPVQRGLIAREIVRQAVLLAARDELGLPTRDEVLGDEAAAGQAGAAADVASLVRNRGPASVRIGRDESEKDRLLERDLLPPTPIHDLADLARAAEALSRDELPKALRALGLDGNPNAVRPEAGLPDSVAEPLEGLGFVEPLAAVRALHEAIRKDGESPERLGALVRGYANLGVLNEFLWSPAHKVFKARAYLYAQRLIARERGSPRGLWHRAYVEALVGRHRRALDDLAEAEALAHAEGAPKAPDWVRTIAAYCRFDLARLQEAGGSRARLAALLRMLALEFPRQGGPSRRAAQEVLKHDPACFRALNVMWWVGGVSNHHALTTDAPQALSRVVPRQVRAIGSLPESVRAPIDRDAGEVALVEALGRAGRPGDDVGEPSWAVLGALIRETRFVHAENRLSFLIDSWSVPVEGFWDEARPLVARHRFQPFLLARAIGTPEAYRAFADSIDEPRLAGLEYSEQPMTYRLGQVIEEKGDRAWLMEVVHMDHLVRDFALQVAMMDEVDEGLWVHNGNKILTLSPEHPYGMTLLVEAGRWEDIEPRLADWEKKGDVFPALVGALGRRYSALKQYDKARDCLGRFIAASPEKWAFDRLAANYRAQGDDANWLATLDRYLAEGEDTGLDRARARAEIADYYMQKRQWEQARPYAEAAAETWAAWAMACALRCSEGLEDWERAETWARRLSERYPATSLRAWLFFCQRTGQGDVESARAFVERYIAANGDPQPPDQRSEPPRALEAGFSAWRRGATDEATIRLCVAYDAGNVLVAGCALVALRDEAGDPSQRDAFLDDLRNRHRSRSPALMDVLNLFREAFARGERDLPDPEALDRALGAVDDRLRGDAEFVAGWFLKDRGRREEAAPHLRRCAESPTANAWLRQLAEDALKRGGSKPATK